MLRTRPSKICPSPEAYRPFLRKQQKCFEFDAYFKPPANEYDWCVAASYPGSMAAIGAPKAGPSAGKGGDGRANGPGRQGACKGFGRRDSRAHRGAAGQGWRGMLAARVRTQIGTERACRGSPPSSSAAGFVPLRTASAGRDRALNRKTTSG